MEVLTVLCIIGAAWLGWITRDRPTGQTCSMCGGTGRFRSGQWGGFQDQCIRCHGTGKM